MGAVTAREVLALLERRGARLAAGEAGLDRPVGWACSMRPRPPAFEELQGGELALVGLGTLHALRAQDDSLTLARLIEDLSDLGVAAIAVVGLLVDAAAAGAAPPPAGPRPVARALPTLAAADRRPPSAEELRCAGARGLPLIALPPGTSLAEVEREVIALIAARRASEPEPEPEPHLVREAHDALMRASLRGEDDHALGQRLADLLGAAVALEDESGLRWCVLPGRFPLARDALVALLRRPSARAELRPGAAGSDAAAPPAVAPGAVRVLPVVRGLLRLLTPLEAGTRERGEERTHRERSGPGAQGGAHEPAVGASGGRPAPPRAYRPAGLSGDRPLVAPAGYPPAPPHAAPGSDVAAYLSLVISETAMGPAVGRALAVERTPSREAAIRLHTAILERVAPLFALALARHHDLVGVEQRLRTETLEVLLAGTYPDEGRMRARAARLGYDLARPHAVLVAELAEPAERPSTDRGRTRAPAPRPRASGDAAPHVAPHAEALAEALAAAFEGAWVRARDDEVAALLPLPAAGGPTELADLAAQAVAPLQRAAGGRTWSAGLSDIATEPSALARAHGQAHDAARLGRLLLGAGRVARPVDLGVYRLLLPLRPSGELEDFCRRTLGPVTADPRTAETNLDTLDAFFACNGNLSEAARQLRLHRNSLNYRIGRLRDLLGHDLDDPEARLALQLALKARRILAL